MSPLADATATDQSPIADTLALALVADVADVSLTADVTAPAVAQVGLAPQVPVAQQQPRGDCQPLWLVFEVESATGVAEIDVRSVGVQEIDQ